MVYSDAAAVLSPWPGRSQVTTAFVAANAAV
jgi:hypothetical protein